jgi:GntR family transcriptional repressor for pyruvate dehydrogenase complex
VIGPLDHSTDHDVDWLSLAPHQSSVAAVVADRLERLIADGELLDGSRMPSERSLAELLGVSRTSVREAVRELWLKGLVDRRQGQGTFVTSARTLKDAFLSHVHDRVADAELTVINVMDYRAALEPPIAARAAERAGPADVSALQKILSDMEAARSARRTAELDAAFHHAVAHATANPLLMQVVEFSSAWLNSTRREALQSPRRRAMSIRSHGAVVRAIIARDPEAAAAAMTQHIKEVSTFVESRLGNTGHATQGPVSHPHGAGSAAAARSVRGQTAPGTKEVR